VVEDTRAWLRCHNMAQRWMKLDGFNHGFTCTPDAGLYVWVEVVGDDGDVDGQVMTVMVVELSCFIISTQYISKHVS